MRVPKFQTLFLLDQPYFNIRSHTQLVLQSPMHPTPLSALRHIRRCNPRACLSPPLISQLITPATSKPLQLLTPPSFHPPPWSSLHPSPITTSTPRLDAQNPPQATKPANRRDVIMNQANRIMWILNEAAGDTEKAKRRLGKCKVTPTRELVAEVLTRCWGRKDGEAAYTFFGWAGKQKKYRHTETEYNTMIVILGEMKRYEKVWTLVDAMRKDDKEVKKKKWDNRTTVKEFLSS